MLCLPTRACAQPGLAVRAVSAIGAHLELAGRLGSGASHPRASLSRPCASLQGWRRSVAWVSSEQPKRAAVAQLRQASLPVLRHVQWKHCRAARLPSSQPRARRPSRTSSSRAPCRRQVLGHKYRTKNDFPENACGFVELIPGPHHHAKGSCWAHSGGRWERLLNTLGTEVVYVNIYSMKKPMSRRPRLFRA